MKIFKFRNHNFGASYLTDNPEQLRYNLDEENASNIAESDYEEIDIDEAIEAIKKLRVGEGWRNQHLSVQCLSMSQAEYDALSEYNGW